ncbi:MAG TPA: succinate dehydrogenase assembly factor 2 [Gammaproteobacteria bacterium]|nr:succinate dehydrogenase assembly factor 2 [Gammaproteobacteria bacterium]
MVGRSSLLWRCRRGIREMDILLQRFVEKEYDVLTDQQKNDFEYLLEQPDLEILDWIIGKSNPESEAMQHLVDRIRAANRVNE